MRGAGCTLNDIADRDYDAQVARTRMRPLPSGRVSVPQAAALPARPSGDRRRGALQPQSRQHPPRARRTRADRHLSLHEADHLVAAALSWAQLQLGRAYRLDRGHRRPRLAAGVALSRRHPVDRSATTRSTPIRTRRTMRGSASNPRPSSSASGPGSFCSRSMAPRWCCGPSRPSPPGRAAGSGTRSPPRRSSCFGRRRGSRPRTRPIASPVPLEPDCRLARLRRHPRRPFRLSHGSS